jgi:GntR family transcriptional regulator
MEIQIDFRSGGPIYLQIVEQVQNMIAQGHLKKGDQLPTVRQLATDLRVNFNTVARAYRLLDEAGLISTQQGRGTYIWEAPADEAMQQLRQRGLRELVQHVFAEAERMGYSIEEVEQAFAEGIQEWKIKLAAND